MINMMRCSLEFNPSFAKLVDKRLPRAYAAAHFLRVGVCVYELALLCSPLPSLFYPAFHRASL